MIEHVKDALWMLNKILSSKSHTLANIFHKSQTVTENTLLSNLNQTLESYYASQSELILACLRVLVTYM